VVIELGDGDSGGGAWNVVAGNDWCGLSSDDIHGVRLHAGLIELRWNDWYRQITKLQTFT